MKRYISFLGLVIVLLAGAQASFADLKIKSKQTMAGQSYENTTYIKGKRQRAETMSGMMVNLTQCDLRRAIQMNPSAKTFIVNEFGDIEPSPTTQDVKAVSAPVTKGGRVVTTVNIKDTGERKKMFGYDARRLIITMDTQSTPDACSTTNTKMEMDGWYIDFAVGFDCDQAYNVPRSVGGKAGGCQDKYEFKQIGAGKRGYPLYEKMTMLDENGKESMTMISEVVELSKATLEASLFEVPADYREVKDMSQLYASAPMDTSDSNPASSDRSSTMSLPNSGAIVSTPTDGGATLGPKQAGVIRIGLSYVKTGAIAKGIPPADLAQAVQNTLAIYLKVPNIEVVTLNGRLPAAIESEAAAAACDYVIYANVSHKKGGGGFGGFGSVLGSTVAQVGGMAGGVAGSIAGNVAAQAISAASVSEQMKNKDEITVDVTLNKTGGAAVLGKQFKAKAKSDGDDIISQVVEQAAQAIVDAVGKK